ncbi:MAG: phosphonate ABC transporter, permease protein PhnE, partial [Alphaproteobacteria bacterium HGW-Alphaproteobacteria-8]
MTDAAPLSAAAAFERDYAAARARARIVWLTGTLVFTALFLMTAGFSDFFKVTQVTLTDGTRAERWIIAAGLPRLGEYVAKTIPVLRWESIGADVAEWFWRWQIWAKLLVETIQIAFMATVFGVVGGFVLSFPAARNLAPNRWLMWLSRRYLEIARTVPELVWALMFVFCFGVG